MGWLDGARRPLFTTITLVLVALGIAAAAAAAVLALSAGGPAPQPTGLAWSAAAPLRSCGAASTPRVAFPASAPNVRSGPGAIVWLGAACPGGGARTLDAAPLAADAPQSPASLTHRPLDRFAALAGTTQGQLVAVVNSDFKPLLGEGRAGHSFARLEPLRGTTDSVATQTGFIGDVDVATATETATGYAIEIRAQRHYQHHFGRTVAIPVGPEPPTAVAIGMDYRADRLLVWDERGELYARYITNKGHIRARQTLGPAGSDPSIAAVLSDNDRAFVIWTDSPPAGTAGTASVLLAHSAIGPRFHGYRTLTSFAQTPALRLGPVAAERLSSEGVALLWPDLTSSGDLALDAAAALSSGQVRAPNVLSLAGQDLALGAVATGPDNELVALLEAAPRSAGASPAIYSVRSNVIRDPGGLGFGALTQLAPVGPNTAPTVAIDPATDHALAAWQSGAAAIDWSLGS